MSDSNNGNGDGGYVGYDVDWSFLDIDYPEQRREARTGEAPGGRPFFGPPAFNPGRVTVRDSARVPMEAVGYRIEDLLFRHTRRMWGDVSAEGAATNDDAVDSGSGEATSFYSAGGILLAAIYVVTYFAGPGRAGSDNRTVVGSVAEIIFDGLGR